MGKEGEATEEREERDEAKRYRIRRESGIT